MKAAARRRKAEYDSAYHRQRYADPAFAAKKNKYTKAWYAADKKKKRSQRLRQNLQRLYGMSLEDYEALLQKQGGRCAICGKKRYGSRSKRLAVDHDHVTNAVRGLLCNACNLGLGMLQDSVAILRKAAAYLRRHKNR